ncbi:MAG TPA: outer membrane beta-barrel protein [Chryseolinea sp.]|nr:outer membrane beta-barrel protein [Chryseolinea sp.]
MNFKILRALGCLAVIGLSISAYGQDSTKFTFGGSVDTYFHSSFGTRNVYGLSSDEGTYYGGYAPSTSFADGHGFSLGMVNLIASYAGEKVGFTADVVFGPRGQAAVFGTASGQAVVNQLFVYYKLGDAVTLNLGQFNTFLGYEVISPALNFHYSTSYLFSWGPFNHTGLRADFDFGNGFVGKLAVMNPTDIVEFNPVNTYTLGLQLGKTTDAGGIWFNFLYGDQDGKLDADVDPDGASSAGTLFQADVTTGWNLSEAFYLGLNASYQMTGEGETVNGNSVDDAGNDNSSFAGVAVYPKLTLSENFALGLRAEYFMVKNQHLNIFGLDDDGDGNVIEFTLSGNYKVGGFTFIPEFRIDMTSEDSFIKTKDLQNGSVDQTLLPSLNLAAVYKF